MFTRDANSLFVYADKFTTYSVQNVRLRMLCMHAFSGARHSVDIDVIVTVHCCAESLV